MAEFIILSCAHECLTSALNRTILMPQLHKTSISLANLSSLNRWQIYNSIVPGMAIRSSKTTPKLESTVITTFMTSFSFRLQSNNTSVSMLIESKPSNSVVTVTMTTSKPCRRVRWHQSGQALKAFRRIWMTSFKLPWIEKARLMHAFAVLLSNLTRIRCSSRLKCAAIAKAKSSTKDHKRCSQVMRP